MYIAQKKRKENIAEYILYLWQLEDLLRALQFSPEAIYSQLVAKSALDDVSRQQVFFWYMDIVNLLRKEGKEESGHLEHTLHLIADLNDLHMRLLSLPTGTAARGCAAECFARQRRSRHAAVVLDSRQRTRRTSKKRICDNAQGACKPHDFGGAHHFVRHSFWLHCHI